MKPIAKVLYRLFFSTTKCTSEIWHWNIYFQIILQNILQLLLSAQAPFWASIRCNEAVFPGFICINQFDNPLHLHYVSSIFTLLCKETSSWHIIALAQRRFPIFLEFTSMRRMTPLDWFLTNLWTDQIPLLQAILETHTHQYAVSWAS